MGRDLRGVRERLVVHRREARDDRRDVLLRHDQLRVMRAEVLGHSFGEGCLVISRLGEADRERTHRRRALGLHQRRDHRRVDAAGEEDAEGDVGDHPDAHGVAQQRFQLARRVFLGPAVAMGHAAQRRLAGRPIDVRIHLARRRIEGQDRAGHQL